MSTEKIINLLQQWQTYTELGNEGDLPAFGAWLAGESVGGILPKRADVFFTDKHATFGYYFGSLIGYADAWERLSFRDLPITGFIDFGILGHVQAEGNPTKKAIAEASTAEQSTVFESIKRMQKKGMLFDQVDVDDKRVKRVFITDYGKEVIEQVSAKAFRLSKLLVGDLSEEEIEQMTRLLRKLGAFHQKLHDEKSKEEIASIYNL